MLTFFRRLFGLTLRQETRPVSAALDVETGSHSQPLLNAISCIDAVHRDGLLPRIPLRRLLLTGKHGQLVLVRGGPVREIAVNYVTRHPELTAIHEIGHFLDYEGIGRPRQWASVDGPLMENWRRVVADSRAIRRLGQIYTWPGDRFPETIPAGNVVDFDIDRPYIQYLLQNEEVWARSYSQYIAVKSGSPQIIEQLNYRRRRPDNGIFYAEQWDDDDFLPISEAIADLFQQLGWRK